MKQQLNGLIWSMIATSLIFTSGCLVEDKGSKEESVGTPTSTPPDFTWTPSPGPAPTPHPTPAPSPSPSPGTTAGIIVENGATITTKESVSVQIFPEYLTHMMKVGFSEDCSDGTWEPYQPNISLQLASPNAPNTISVSFLDYENQIGDCYKKSIVHDNLGPSIIFSKYPAASLEEGSTAELIYEVQDGAGVSRVKCHLNSLDKNCAAGTNNVTITALPEGDYVFTVEATDRLGNSSSQSVNFSAVSSTRKLTQTIAINNYRKVDILMVIDNSGSMAYEQQNMATRTSNLLSIIRGLDWQIGVTTTDPSNGTYGDGRLVPIFGTNGQYILDTTTAEADAQYKLGKTLQRSETGSGSEQGIFATYRAIERSRINGNPAHQQLIREGAQLAVLVISDEDESANGTKNDPAKLIQLVNQTYGGQKTFSFHSIITVPGDTQCKNTYGATYGERYKTLSNLTGGVIGSVCAADYASQVSGIANGIRNLLKTLTLECTPLTQFPIEVLKDGVPYTEPFTTSGVNLNFASELPPGSFQVQYRCLK